MQHVTDDFDDLVHDEFVCCCDEPEPWRYLFYEDRDDAFEAVDAAELLGLSWRLRNASSGPEDAPLQYWVVELLLVDASLPLAATGSISRDVE